MKQTRFMVVFLVVGSWGILGAGWLVGTAHAETASEVCKHVDKEGRPLQDLAGTVQVGHYPGACTYWGTRGPGYKYGGKWKGVNATSYWFVEDNTWYVYLSKGLKPGSTPDDIQETPGDCIQQKEVERLDALDDARRKAQENLKRIKRNRKETLSLVESTKVCLTLEYSDPYDNYPAIASRPKQFNGQTLGKATLSARPGFYGRVLDFSDFAYTAYKWGCRLVKCPKNPYPQDIPKLLNKTKGWIEDRKKTKGTIEEALAAFEELKQLPIKMDESVKKQQCLVNSIESKYWQLVVDLQKRFKTEDARNPYTRGQLCSVSKSKRRSLTSEQISKLRGHTSQFSKHLFPPWPSHKKGYAQHAEKEHKYWSGARDSCWGN